MTTKLTELPEETSTTIAEINIKTIHPLVNGVIALISFPCIAALLNLFFNNPQLIILGAVVAAYLISKLLSVNYTTLTLDEHSLQIRSESQFSNFHRQRVLDLTLICGYEFHVSKTFNQLAIYRKNKSPYVLTLVNHPNSEIAALFNNRIPLIDKKNHLSTRTFPQAFFAGFLFLACFWLLQILSVSIYEYTYFQNYHYFFKINLEHLFKVGIIGLFIILTFNHICNNLPLRITGRIFGNFILCLTLILTIAAINSTKDYSYEPLTVNTANDVFKNLKSKIFVFKNEVELDRQLIGCWTDLHHSRKSSYIKFDQYLACPIILNSYGNNLWIGDSYQGKFKKYLNEQERESVLKDEYKKNKHPFLNQFSAKARFYEVVYSALNPAFREHDYYRSARSTRKVSYPIIILKAHYEPFKQYKLKILDQSFFIGGICILLIITGALVIAYNR